MNITLPFGFELVLRKDKSRRFVLKVPGLGEVLLRKSDPDRGKTYSVEKGWFKAGGMEVSRRNIDFLAEAKFMQAYRAGMFSGHRFGQREGEDLHIEWKVHTCLWAAAHAARLDGEFVECGVNTGILSLAILEYLDFKSPQLEGRSFFLFDTFCGIPEEQMSPSEASRRKKDNERMYVDCWELAQKNFSPYPNARLIRGRVPETLASVDIGKVAYLSIDMNIVAPEIAALEYFWDKMVVGGVIVLDDYGGKYHVDQYRAINTFAESRGVSVFHLPTGQGIILKS